MSDQIISLIRAGGLSRVAEELAGMLQPAVIVTEQETTAAGHSVFGGAAELPAGLPRPTWRGEPLPLLADFRLAELQPFDELGELPHDGRLLFFFEVSALEDYPPAPDSWRVIHCPEAPEAPEAPESAEHPEHPERPEPADGKVPTPRRTPVVGAPAPRGLGFARRLTLPPSESSAVEALALDSQESDAYDDLLENVNLTFDADETHQLLGHPCQLQGDLQQECLDDTGRGTAPEDWRLLLQLTESKEMVWGDGGILYFFIRRQALREADFSDVHLVMQCG